MTDPLTKDLEHMLRTAGRWAVAPDPAVAQQIQNLVQVYALYTDAGRAAEVGGLFTADAVWDGREVGYGLAEGPEAIGLEAAGHFRAAEPMMHLPGPPLLIVVRDDEVHGVCWCLATRWTNGSTIPLIHFYYDDVIRRCEDGQWRFARRLLRPAFPPGPPR